MKKNEDQGMRHCKKPRYREQGFSVPQTLTSLRLWEEKASIQRTPVLCPSNSYESKVVGRVSCHDSGKEIEWCFGGDSRANYDRDFNKNIEDNYNNEGYNNNKINDEKPRFWEGGFVEKRCSRRLTYTSSPKLLLALTLINKTKIKSELVRFNFV